MLNAMNLALILTSVAMSSGAQLVLKTGGRKLAADGKSLATMDIGYLLSPAVRWVFFGLFLYGLAALIWVRVLVQVDLGLAYPFVGLGFILVALLSYLVLGEPLLASRIGGSVLIAIGCLIVATGK